MAYEQSEIDQAREIINFQVSYNKQRIKATWALAIVIVTFFLLEEFFGGSQNVTVLVRMGANVSERVKDGEYYRLLSSVFLHAGWMHVFFNTYVLVALGGFFNRILGESKYLTVFFCSGICGSLASVFFGKSSVSVGASGAIWGLFGVSLALATFKTTLLPEPIRLQLRRITIINLVINLGISFLPMIDFWAHIGGGIGGLVIGLWIIASSKYKNIFVVSKYLFRVLAVVLALIYAASLAYGLWLYQPWKNQLTSAPKTVDLAPLPFSIDIPEGLKQTSDPGNNARQASFTFGSFDLDQTVVELKFFHEETIGGTANADWLATHRQALIDEPVVPAEVKKSVYLHDTPEGTVLYYQQMPNKEIVVHNYMFTREEYVIKILLVVPNKVTRARVDSMAQNMMKSVKSK